MPPTFYLRTDNPTAVLASGIRQVLGRVGPDLKIRSLRSMDEVIDRALLRERIIAQLAGVFGGFALLLACLGLYGILSFRVAQRTREIGLRVALGATLWKVIALVLHQGLKLVVVGGAIGSVVALTATRSLAALLYGVSPADPLTFAAVLGALTGAASLACWLPARRAANVDAMTALRCE
jgi:ABC-type antimicrobial peptide transport system permease subunit